MKMKYFISWILVTILFTTYVLAQQGITTDSLKIKVNHKRSLPTSKINELFQNAKITPELEEKLKTINLDIRGYLSLHEGQDERCSALFCELIFIGKVLSIVDMPGPKSDLFHSKVNIQIVEILKGPKQIKDTIQLMRKGGPITADIVNGILPGTIFQTTTDAIYRIGETSVFYANTIDNDPRLIPGHKSNFSQLILKYPKPSYWVSSLGKYKIKDSFVEYFGRKIPLEQFRTEIKQVSQIVDQP